MSSLTFSAFSRAGGVGVSLLLLCSSNVYAQNAAKSAVPGRATAEQRTARAFEAAGANPLDLHAFLVRMPKGADLHNHLSGAIYAESWIRAAAEDGLCVDLASLSFANAAAASAQPACADGKVSVTAAYTDQHLYDALIDAFSMRSFVPSAGVSGHDHFLIRLGSLTEPPGAIPANGLMKLPRALPHRTNNTSN